MLIRDMNCIFKYNLVWNSTIAPYSLSSTEGQTDGAWKPSNNSGLSEIGEHWIEKHSHFRYCS
jgi:hypothetical protein